jgi:hypothetical protein
VATAQRNLVANVSVPVLAPMNNYFGFVFQPLVFSVIERIALRTMFDGGISPWSSPCGSDCSYTFSFLGPAYQCMPLGPFNSTGINLTEIWDQNDGGPAVDSVPPFVNNSLLYYAFGDAGNETNPAGIWILYDSFNQTLKCDLYNATYTAAVSYSGNVQTIQKNLEFHNFITDGIGIYKTLVDATESQLNDLVNNGTFWAPLNLILLQLSPASILGGWLILVGSHITVSTDVAEWPMVAQWQPSDTGSPSPLKLDNLATNVQDYMANFTLSLINYRNANINVSELADVTSDLIIETITSATSTSSPLVYIYTPVTLWQGYACALGFTIICVMVGSFMLYSNGVAGELTFSQVLVTTRNPTLDQISEGAGLGGKYITDRVKNVKVKYGTLSGTEKVGFGTKDEILSLPLREKVASP